MSGKRTAREELLAAITSKAEEYAGDSRRKRGEYLALVDDLFAAVVDGRYLIVNGEIHRVLGTDFQGEYGEPVEAVGLWTVYTRTEDESEY